MRIFSKKVIGMNSDDFKNIGFYGRIAFGINCFEEALIFLKYDISKWKPVLERLWTFTNAEFFDDWLYLICEILPECILEFGNYTDDYEYIDEKEYYYFYELYQNMDNRLETIMGLIHRLGESHIYSVIINNGPESLENVQEIIDFMFMNDLPIPNIEAYKTISIAENNGWGNLFDDYSPSILKNYGKKI